MPFKKKKAPAVSAVQTAGERMINHPFSEIDGYVPLSTPHLSLYATLREAVPVIDAAIRKLVVLTGGFDVRCDNAAADEALHEFIKNVPVGGNQNGIWAFVAAYLDQLLSYGTAVGEMTVSGGRIAGLYNAPLKNIELHRRKDGFGIDVCLADGKRQPVKYPELILLSALDPEPGKLGGTSLLKGLPFVSSVLLKIYNTIGLNFERVGNVRFAVTYRPQNDPSDRAYAKDRAMEVARQWGDAMQPGGRIKDFVTVGDVSIKVIGADNQILDSEVPVRQMLEQIVAKTGIPPFMLGLSWSSTERMSAQQSDVLTSELEGYRRILTPVIERICVMFLRTNGFGGTPEVVWDDITLQDGVELARARLYNAQAEMIESQRS
ncbi:MAG: serine/threonine protein phosphatase [Clostridiales bacterium]|nr:serine/threonine protein phosphatase [Clostridiales bacterium]